MAVRVLIVDDHKAIRIGIRTMLTDMSPLEVCGEAEDGLDALQKVVELSPDVVILDLTMPGMNGFETAGQMRLIAPSMKIIFYSLHDVPAVVWLSGADAFVSKSSDPHELAMAVNRVLQPT